MPHRAASPVLARNQALAPGRLSTLALVGGAAGVLPLPFLSWTALRRVKGAVAHDIATRHGLCLSNEAREALAAPFGGQKPTALVSTVTFLARRAIGRLGPLGLLPPLSAWLEVYALGLLFDRYLTKVRSSNTVRIEVVEAKRVAALIERSIRRAFSLKLQAPPGTPMAVPVEDARDPATRFFDGILLGLAAVPHAAQRRLESAFDEEAKGANDFDRI